jgi:DNA-binding transcriptional LysR family regulator
MVKPESVTFHPTGTECAGRLYCAPTHPLAKYRDTALPDDIRIEDYPAIGISGLSSANYIEDDSRLAIQTFSDSYDACMSAIMTGEYVGLLPDYMRREQGASLGLVPIANGELFNFSHELFIMNGKNTRLNPVLRHCIKELSYFISESQSSA